MQSHLSGLRIFGTARDHISQAGIDPFAEGCCALIRRTHPPQVIRPRRSLRHYLLESTKNGKDRYRFGQPMRVKRLSYAYIAEVKADAEKATSLYNIFHAYSTLN